MIKIIHVITDMKIGGAGRWLLNFLKNYDESKLDIKVVIPKGSMLKAEINRLNLETIEIHGIGDKSLDWASVNAFRRLFMQERPQIVHTHASLSARIAAKLTGVKAIVHTKHCLDNPRTGIKKAVAAGINNQLSSRIIAVSKAVEKNLLEAGMPQHKIQVIYGGTEKVKTLPKEEINQIKASYGIGEKDIVFGIVARLAEVKGHKYLIQAAEQVLKNRNDIKFLIAGTGPLEDQLKKMVLDLGIENSVVFTGFIKDVENIYNIIDVNMITSSSEALCLSLIEGMSLDKPMIGTEVGGVPELVIQNQTGLLVPVADVEILADAIEELAGNSELRNSMGMNAGKMMLEKFSASEMAAEILKLYQEVVK
ncbi:MAG TPA: glycosyltransferase [Patescibacteria group bacterium]|nr:glycosyltransferase [Patescibacteria group bacterium]